MFQLWNLFMEKASIRIVFMVGLRQIFEFYCIQIVFIFWLVFGNFFHHGSKDSDLHKVNGHCAFKRSFVLRPLEFFRSIKTITLSAVFLTAQLDPSGPSNLSSCDCIYRPLWTPLNFTHMTVSFDLLETLLSRSRASSVDFLRSDHSFAIFCCFFLVFIIWYKYPAIFKIFISFIYNNIIIYFINYYYNIF